MKLLHCPEIGLRPLAEFIFGGEVRPMPNADACSDAQWASYVYNREGAPGVNREWWYHTPSGIWLIAERNTATDEVYQTWLAANFWQELQT